MKKKKNHPSLTPILQQGNTLFAAHVPTGATADSSHSQLPKKSKTTN
jgi:hypothetical protein